MDDDWGYPYFRPLPNDDELGMVFMAFVIHRTEPTLVLFVGWNLYQKMMGWCTIFV